MYVLYTKELNCTITLINNVATRDGQYFDYRDNRD